MVKKAATTKKPIDRTKEMRFINRFLMMQLEADRQILNLNNERNPLPLGIGSSEFHGANRWFNIKSN